MADGALDEQAMAAALPECSVLPLVAAAVHLSGDPSLIRGSIRPTFALPNEFDGGLAEDEREALREAAGQMLVAHRDATPVEPAADIVRELMEWMAGRPLDDDYVALFGEEMDLAGDDPRRIELATGDPASISVLVIGLGMSGLLAGLRLQQAGIPFEIVEKNGDVGGTWYENSYPGCRVDVANHYYCYSFEPIDGFGHYYCERDELHGYFRGVMQRHGVDAHVRWNTEVERAAWDESASAWRVELRAADGTTDVRTATAIISAVGQLNRPSIPDLPNVERFAGPVFHSARWDHDVDLTGKRVALVGAGASGFQIAPTIADQVEQLTIFQRTAQWVYPNLRYHDAVRPGELWAMEHLPGYARWYRFLVLLQTTDIATDAVRVDPTWPDLPLSANAISAAWREVAVAWIESQVDDPELLAKVVPAYPPLGKRLLQDNGTWFRCLQRPNVELVRAPITDIEADAVVADARYDADVLVFATGFRANEFLFPMEVIGRGGVSLDEWWAGKPAGYLGISVPGFPNFFMMYGPGTNLAHTGSIILQSECQMRYIGGCLARLVEQGGGTIEPTEAAFVDYVQRLQDELDTTIWTMPEIEHSWYKAADGHCYILSPWRLVDYWSMTEAPRDESHVVTQ